MGTEESKTLQKILDVGMKEFLDKGFKSASLRNIVKNAGVTTGAFYGYFSNKEALFAALVEQHAAAVMSKFMQAQEDFENLPEELQPEHMGIESTKCTQWMIDYIFDHYDAFKLIICKSEGTPYENFVHNMVEVEVESTYRFIDVLRSLGKETPDIDRQFCHIICSGMFNGIFEMIVHDMPRAFAHKYVRELQEFYTAGWSKIMGL